MKFKIILIAMLNIFNFSCAQKKSTEITYGQVIKYSKNKPIIYPDFKLTFKGEEEVKIKGTNLIFTYYNFELETVQEKKTISWTSGTGVIDPLLFEVAGKKYFIEMKITERFIESEKAKYADRVKSYTRKIGNYGVYKDETYYTMNLKDNEIVISEDLSQE